MTEETAPAIEVVGLTKVFRPAPRWLRMMIKSPIRAEKQVLDSIAFRVERGEVCALIGPNGAGKTTLFRVLVGLTTPTEGTAHILGHDAVGRSLRVRRLIGWMPTSSQSLFGRHTCAENLRFHGRLRGLTSTELERTIDESLEMVGLSAVKQDSVLSLSAGMTARLQLARALLHKPRLLILDEPTASVDPVAAYDIVGLILDIVKADGLAAIVSSHRLDEIEALHSHVLLLHQGRILFDGNLDTLRGRLDRARLELRFDSDQSAKRASHLLSRMPVVEAHDLHEASITANITPGTPVGQVYRGLGDSVHHLVRANEVGVPLREVLAEVYGLKDPPASSEAT